MIPTSTTYKIETGIPLPDPREGRYADAKYPFRVLKIGDSFFVPVKGSAVRPQINVMGAAAYYRKNGGTGRAFTSRMVRGGVRVWRTK